MGGLLNALNAGKTSLSVNQKSIEVVGNNVANVNTPGYSRQEAVLSPYPALNFGGFFIGQGVKVSDVQREHNAFLQGQINDKNQTLGQEEAKTEPLEELERVFSVGDESLATEIDRFFDAWQQLTANPGSPVERDIVRQRGELLGQAFDNLQSEMNTIRSNINNTLSSKVDQVNLKLEEVADLNKRIKLVEAGGNTANTFRDRRDRLLSELSKHVGAKSIEEKDNTVTVQLPGGMPLVQGGNALTMERVQEGSDLSFQLRLNNTELEAPNNQFGGEFSGLLDVRDRIMDGIGKELDNMQYKIRTYVNQQHEAGVGLDGETGRSFFAKAEHYSSYNSFSNPDAGGFDTGDLKLSVAGQETTVAIDSNNNSLQGMRDAINNSGAEVLASVIKDQDSGGYKLSLTPTTQGEEVKVNTSNLSGGSKSIGSFCPKCEGEEQMQVQVADTAHVAAGNSSAPGDNTNAQDIAALANAPIMQGTDTFSGYYGKVAADVGLEAGNNDLVLEGAKDALTQLNNLRDGKVGVSLEEEMIDLIQFQKGFEASSKFLSTVDEMMDSVINLKR